MRATPKPNQPDTDEQFDDDERDIDVDPESLQSVESEHVDSYYEEDEPYGTVAASNKIRGRWSLFWGVEGFLLLLLLLFVYSLC